MIIFEGCMKVDFFLFLNHLRKFSAHYIIISLLNSTSLIMNDNRSLLL